MAEWSKAPVSYLAEQWDAGSIPAPGPAKITFCDEIFLNSSRVARLRTVNKIGSKIGNFQINNFPRVFGDKNQLVVRVNFLLILI